MEKALRVAVILSAVDKLSKVVDGAVNSSTKSLQRLQKEANALGDKAFGIGRKAGAIALVAAAPLVASAKSAMEFEAQMSNVATIVDTTTESMSAMGNKVLDISKRVPVQVADLTSALYDVRSAGISAGNAMGVLEMSAKLSVAGLSTTAEATNIMTSAMNAFKTEGLSSAQIADIIFKTVKAGKTTVAELTQAFGASAPIIQSAGVKLADFQAATAALTTVGTPAAQAQNQIRAAIVALQKPTADMEKIFKQLGVTSEKELIAREGGIVGAFNAINGAGGKMGINMAKAWSSVEAGAAVTSLTGATNQAYVDTLNDMTKGAGQLEGAFNKQASTNAAKMQQFKNNIGALAISVGNMLLPTLNSLMEKIVSVMNRVSAWTEKHPRLTKLIIGAVAAIAALSMTVSALAFVFGGAMKVIAFGSMVFKGLSIAIGFVSSAFKILRIIMMANPIIAIVMLIAGLALVVIKYWDKIVGFFKWLWDKVKGIFRSFFNWLVDNIPGMRLIVDNWDKIVGYFKGLWEKVKAPFRNAYNWIKGLGQRFYQAGANIVNSIWNGLKSKFQGMVDWFKGGLKKLRDMLPFSPAKEGPLRDIHRLKFVETIAGNIKPGPMVKAMDKATGAVRSRLSSPAGSIGGGAASGGGGGVVVNFNPTINVTGGSTSSKQEFLQMLREYQPELMRVINEAMARQERTKFA